MPIFVYECPGTDCQERIEIFRRSSETDAITCQKCNRHELVKVPSTWGTYSIKGNNGASQTPKRFRGGRPS